MVNRMRVGPPGWSVAFGCATAIAGPVLAGGEVSLPDPSPTPGSVLADSLVLHPRWVIAGDRARRLPSPTGPSSTGGILLWPREPNGIPNGEPLSFVPAGLKRSDRFSEAMALAGDLLFVGAPGWDQSLQFPDAGRVHVIDLGGEAPVALGVLPIGSSAASQEFGSALAAHMDDGVASVAVGAPGYKVGAPGAIGRVRLLVNGAQGWELNATITGPVAYVNSGFATALGLNAAHLAVGAPGCGAMAPLSWGHVFLYDRANASAEPLILTAPTPVLDDHFGAAIALGEDLLVIGAPSNECDAGAAHVFRSVRGAWLHEATLTPPDADPAGWYGFGNDVALERERVIVASGATVADELLGQRAAVFRRAGTSWVLEHVIDGASDGPSDASAAGLAGLDPSGALIAQPLGGPAQAGALRFDALPRSADLDFDGKVGAADLASVLGAWGNDGVLPEDLSGDGTVDATDLAILIGEWSVRR